MGYLMMIGQEFLSRSHTAEYVQRVLNQNRDFSHIVLAHTIDSYLTLFQKNKESTFAIVVDSQHFTKTLEKLKKLSSTSSLDFNLLESKDMRVLSINQNAIYLIKYSTQLHKNLHLKTTALYYQVLGPKIEEINFSLKQIFPQDTYTVVSKTSTWHELKVVSSEIQKVEKFEEIAKDVILKTKSPNQYIVETLTQMGQSIAFAESCTGGLMVGSLIKQAGASSVINASLVAYANGAKRKYLNVDKKVLVDYGAVSKETIGAMVDGVLEFADADIGVAISGIAGPLGGVEGKPVGTVYIGVGNQKTHVIRRNLFAGDREMIQNETLLAAYEMILEFIREIHKKSLYAY